MSAIQMHLPHFVPELGAHEKRTEPYRAYGEGISECATTFWAKSNYKVAGFAGDVVFALGMMQ
jgi:hypothetical protein